MRRRSRPAADNTHVTTYVPIVVAANTIASANSAETPYFAAAKNVGSASTLGDDPTTSMIEVRVAIFLASAATSDSSSASGSRASRSALIAIHNPNAIKATPDAMLT